MKFNIQPISGVANIGDHQEQQQENKRQVRKVEHELTTTITVVPTRKGIHDKRVEVWVDSEIKETFLSQVQVGQPWHALEGNFSSKWYICLSPVRLDYSRDSKNPTIIIGAMNVLQAESMESRVHKPAAARLTSRVTVSDVEDVELLERR
jgi:hypothetical protein